MGVNGVALAATCVMEFNRQNVGVKSPGQRCQSVSDDQFDLHGQYYLRAGS